MPRRASIPSYRLHRQSGQAIVTLSDHLGTRRDVLLGQYNTPESRAEYARVIAEWEASGRRLAKLTAAAASDLSVNEPRVAYYGFAGGYYRKNGERTSQPDQICRAIKPVTDPYGRTLDSRFAPEPPQQCRAPADRSQTLRELRRDRAASASPSTRSKDPGTTSLGWVQARQAVASADVGCPGRGVAKPGGLRRRFDRGGGTLGPCLPRYGSTHRSMWPERRTLRREFNSVSLTEAPSGATKSSHEHHRSAPADWAATANRLAAAIPLHPRGPSA